MTTPAAMNSLIEEIRYRFGEARAKAECNAAVAPNSYGAGYDLGYSDALGELLEHITGDATVTPGHRAMNQHTHRYWEGRWRDEKAHNDALVKALQGIAEFSSGDDTTLGALGRLASIRNTALNVLAHMWEEL